MPDNQTVSHSQSLIRKIIFIFWLWFNLRLNNFLSKHKISEHQINPKVLSVASSCHYNGNSKNGKNRFQTNARPSGAIPTNPRPRAKARMQKPQGGGKFWCKSPGVRGGMVMDEIDTCISKRQCLIRAICYFQIIDIKQGEATVRCVRSCGKCSY